MNFKEFIYNAIGKLYISSELLESKEKRLLHISDTPVSFFNELKLLITKLKPAYIVHTGDLTDNIKLQRYPSYIDEHEKWIKHLAAMFEASEAEIVLALGNHDNFDIVKSNFKGSRIIRVADTIKIEGLSFRVSHLPAGVLQAPAEYNLFGHDLTMKSGRVGDKFYFNGISHINLIGLESREHVSLHYPIGTDDARLGRRKTGL